MAAKKKERIFKFSKYMKKKLLVIFTAIILMLIVLIVQIMRLQKDSGEKYKRIVLNQQGYDSETIPFRRGDIMDSKGTILATSEDVYNVILDCKLILEDEKYIEPTIQAVLKCFDDVTEEELRGILEEKKDSQYCVLRKKLPYEEIQDFVQLQEQVYTKGKKKGQKKNPNVKGVWFEKEYIRNYPYDALACKVLGFTTSGNVGIGGLEDYYNDDLNGINGRRYGYLNSDNDMESTIKDAVNGHSIITTLDLNVQSIVEQKIAEFDAAHRDEAVDGPGSVNTAALVMNPNTGEIIAMADSTGYNLNDPWNEEQLVKYCMDYKGYTQEEAANLQEDTRLDMLNALWQNFCITYTYEPGSTVKPLTVATGLDTGTVSANDTYVCDGGEWVGGHHINCVNENGHGTETVEQAVMNSCNDALMAMSRQIGVDLFTKYQNIFNIGLKTNIDLPGEARTDTLIYTAERMRQQEAALATNAFGQNYNTTMIQVASAFASVINGGYYYQPHLVKKIIDENGGTVQTVEPVVLKQTISAQTSELIRGYLESTVAAGTGNSAKVPGYSMGGKTGTAEKQPRGNKKFLVSFIGFAPAEHPELLVYVVINEPNLEKQSQSSLATNLAKEIMAEIFPYLNIFPDEPVEETEAGKDGQEPPDDGADGQAPPEGEGDGQEPSDDGVDTQEPPEGEGDGQGPPEDGADTQEPPEGEGDGEEPPDDGVDTQAPPEGEGDGQDAPDDGADAQAPPEEDYEGNIFDSP